MTQHLSKFLTRTARRPCSHKFSLFLYMLHTRQRQLGVIAFRYCGAKSCALTTFTFKDFSSARKSFYHRKHTALNLDDHAIQADLSFVLKAHNSGLLDRFRSHWQCNTHTPPASSKMQEVRLNKDDFQRKVAFKAISVPKTECHKYMRLLKR